MSVYQIETPEQLKAISKLSIDGSARNMATAWSAEQRRKGGSIWDGRIRIVFRSEPGKRICALEIDDRHGGTRETAHFHYNSALNWCKGHLKEATKNG